MGTIFSDDRHCESPVSSVPESTRPISLNGASAWRDQTPDLTFYHVEDPDDAIRHLSKISEAEHSSTCHDRGDSAHLENALGPYPPDNTDPYPTLSTDELLAGFGTGFDSQDPRLEFLDIPSVKSQDKTLEEQLRNATRRYPRNDGQKFIPISDFDKIVTRENVRREVQSWLPEDRSLEIWVKAIWDTFDYDEHTTRRRKAFTSRRKIFAILVLFNAQTKIASFIREELWDKDLPFVQNEENKWVHYPRKSQDEPRLVESLNQLEVHDADSFDNYQWFMLSPIFNMAEDKVIHYDLQARITLPFLEHELGHNRALGGQGEVSRIRMHGSHCILTKSIKDPVDIDLRQPEYFAIKQLTSPDKSQFDSEVESLKRFSNDNHPHLIKLLATYHHKEKFHLIFPWADGNLRDLWERHSKPIQNYSTIRWIADQCRGIAKGLRMIHNNEFKPNITSLQPKEKKMGRHGDMKPENILWFKGPDGNEQFESDVLKISDFGLTRWHGNMSNDKTDIHRLAVSRSYRAPEYDLWKPVSQSWDIWSLACLYLEFITWYLCGWNEGVDEFSKDRTKENSTLTREGNYAISEDDFFNLVTKHGPSVDSNAKYEASLKRSVISWINKLHATKGCSQFIHDFLDLISDMMLRIRSEKRTRCEDIVMMLDALYNKCEDEVYCSKSNPCARKKKRNDSDPPGATDTAIIEFSEEETKRLSQRISVDSVTRASSGYNIQGIENDSIPPAHVSSGGQNNQQHPSLGDSNQPTLSSGQLESKSLATPTLRPYSTKSSSTTMARANIKDETDHSSQQTLSDDVQQSKFSSPTNDQSNTDTIPLKPPTVEQTRASLIVTSQSSTLPLPTDNRMRSTSSEQERASSQETRGGNDQASTGKIEEKQTMSKWKRIWRWIKSVTCLARGITEK